MKISRQHSETKIDEFNGLYCEQLFGLGQTLSAGLSLFYIVISGVSYKFFIDEGVLFWSEALQDPEDDLTDNEKYIDILSCYDIQNEEKLNGIHMKNGMLEINIGGGRLKFTNIDDMMLVHKVYV